MSTPTNAMVVQGQTPDSVLAPIRIDDLGRIEMVQVASTDQPHPTVPISGSINAAITGTATVSGSLTTNPTMPTLLAQVLLGATDTVIYTAAANWRDVQVFVSNVDTAERTCQVALGSSMTDTTTLVKSYPLAIGDRGAIFVPSLANTQVLRGLCDSANKVVAQVWGVAA